LYQTSKNFEESAATFKEVVKYAPYDWQALAKLIQLYQVEIFYLEKLILKALGQLEQRDSARINLIKLWREGKVQSPRFCREQFDRPEFSQRILVYEHFTLTNQGETPIKYACKYFSYNFDSNQL
jgi:hypothetical protein